MLSLIVCSVDRVSELAKLLASLERQTSHDFEVILVDQNRDERLLSVLRAHPALSIRHLRSERGLSRSRNVGLRFACGDIIAIPDDDCWYPETLVASVVAWFGAHPDFHGLSTIKKDADGKPVGPKWPRSAREIVLANVFECAISSTIFLRRSVVESVGDFNQAIGVGARSAYQAGEETDYLLRALKAGFRLWYEPALTVHHPPLNSIDRLRSTSYPFALGAGYVLRIHGFSLWYFLRVLARSLGGALVSCMKVDFENARIYLIRAAGQFRGYFWGPRDLQRFIS